MKKTGDFESIFYPRSIAVIGASSDPGKFGGRAYMVIRERCGHEKLYPVNPSVNEIDGVKTHASILEIDDDIEFAIITVPAPLALKAVQECAKKKVRAVEILTAGFSETGAHQGIQWEKEIAGIARRNGMRIIGPNCFGVYSPESALTIIPGSDFPRKAGELGLIAQSGGVANFLVRKAAELDIRFSKAVSYGNACDLNEADFLSYFLCDGQTRIIAAYLEGLRDGRRFFEIARRTALEKPLVIWKGGLTDLGSRAVISHTASLGGSQSIWDGFFRQTGAVPAADADEALDLIIGLGRLPGFTGRRVAVVGGGGAIAVAAADALERAGLSMPPFSPETRQAIRNHLPPSGNSATNPVDMGSPLFEPKSLRAVLEPVADAATVDIVIVEHMVFRFMSGFNEELAEVVPSVNRKTGKPFVVTLPHTSTAPDAVHVEQTRRKYRQWYLARGIPVYDSTHRAANVLKKVIGYHEFVNTAGQGRR